MNRPIFLYACQAIILTVVSTAPISAAPRRPAADNANSPQKATIAEIKANEFSVGTDVVVEGTVYYFDPVWRFYFLGDENEFIFVEGSQGVELDVGARVRLRGRVNEGHVNVVIGGDSLEVEVTGHESVGSPIEVDIAELNVGEFDSRWIQTTASVEFVMIEGSRVWLRCLSGDETQKDRAEFTACLPIDADFEKVAPLVGSNVRLRGSLGISINRRDEVDGLLVFLTEPVETLKEPLNGLSVPEPNSLGEVTPTQDRLVSFFTSGQVTFLSLIHI